MNWTWQGVLRTFVFLLCIAACIAGFVVCIVLGYVNTFLEWVAHIGSLS